MTATNIIPTPGHNTWNHQRTRVYLPGEVTSVGLFANRRNNNIVSGDLPRRIARRFEKKGFKAASQGLVNVEMLEETREDGTVINVAMISGVGAEAIHENFQLYADTYIPERLIEDLTVTYLEPFLRQKKNDYDELMDDADAALSKAEDAATEGAESKYSGDEGTDPAILNARKKTRANRASKPHKARAAACLAAAGAIAEEVAIPLADACDRIDIAYSQAGYLRDKYNQAMIAFATGVFRAMGGMSADKKSVVTRFAPLDLTPINRAAASLEGMNFGSWVEYVTRLNIEVEEAGTQQLAA